MYAADLCSLCINCEYYCRRQFCESQLLISTRSHNNRRNCTRGVWGDRLGATEQLSAGQWYMLSMAPTYSHSGFKSLLCLFTLIPSIIFSRASPPWCGPLTSIQVHVRCTLIFRTYCLCFPAVYVIWTVLHCDCYFCAIQIHLLTYWHFTVRATYSACAAPTELIYLGAVLQLLIARACCCAVRHGIIL